MTKKNKPANEVWVVRVGEDRYLHRGGGELLNEIDLWRGTFRDEAGARRIFEFEEHDKFPGHYAVITDSGNVKRGPKMKVVRIKCSFEEIK